MSGLNLGRLWQSGSFWEHGFRLVDGKLCKRNNPAFPIAYVDAGLLDQASYGEV